MKSELAKFDRRDFMRLAGGTALAATGGRLLAQTPASATLSFRRNAPLAVMPADFVGLSYESPQLANPAFFSPGNIGLTALIRQLSPQGVLRTGGNLSAFTGWRDDPKIPATAAEQAAMDRGKKYWEWALTDPTIAEGNHEAIFTPASIKPLAAFLRATGWKLLYGLNFGTGTPEQAAAEAACVQQLVGANLIGFQLGNEIDFWVGGLRPKDWDFDHYFAQWTEWTRAIRAKVPSANFAGPDVAIRLDWMEKMAESQKSGLTLLTKHHYAMGPAGDPKMNAARLLGPDPENAKEIASARRAKAFAGVGFRTAECGSCYHGGQPGVSNAFASALWGADYMLTLAQGGHAGVNMHGGGSGFYSPIVGDEQSGIKARPLFFGMQFAQQFAGGTILQSALSSSVNANAYVAERSGDTLVAFINKDANPIHIDLEPKSVGKMKLGSIRRLAAPAIDSLSGVTFDELKPTQAQLSSVISEGLDVAPYTAYLLTFTA